jgi:hypothetical protein
VSVTIMLVITWFFREIVSVGLDFSLWRFWQYPCYMRLDSLKRILVAAWTQFSGIFSCLLCIPCLSPYGCVEETRISLIRSVHKNHLLWICQAVLLRNGSNKFSLGLHRWNDLQMSILTAVAHLLHWFMCKLWIAICRWRVPWLGLLVEPDRLPPLLRWTWTCLPGSQSVKTIPGSFTAVHALSAQIRVYLRLVI